MNSKPQILVVRQLALGDVLLVTPIIKQLYLDYSGDCDIDVLTLKPEVFLNNPYVANVVSPEKFSKENKFYQKIINLDLAYERNPNVHIIDAYAKYSHGSIDFIKDKKIELFPSNDDIELINDIEKKIIGGKFLVIHMRRDTWPSRNLSEVTWRSIVEGLLSSTELMIVQVGSTHEISFENNDRLINLLGRLTIQQLNVLIEKSECYIGIDSGTLHIASSTNSPIVSIFTSAHHQFRKPLGRGAQSLFVPVTPDVECYGCQSRMMPPITGVICPNGDPYSPPCKDAISTNSVIKAVQAIAKTTIQ